MKLTSKKLEWFSEIGEQIIPIAEEYALIKFKVSGNISIDEFYSWGISFRSNWETGSHGCYDNHQFDFDMTFEQLSNSNLIEELKTKKAEEKRIEEEKEKLVKEQKAINEKFKKEQRDKLEYERLRKKYEHLYD